MGIFKAFTALTLEALRLLRPIVRLSYLLALMAALIGCRHRTIPLDSQSATLNVIFAVDSSASAYSQLGSALETLGLLCPVLRPSTWLWVLKFDNSTQEIYSGPVPKSREDLLKKLIPQFASRSTKDNTYLDEVLTVATRQAATAKGNSILFIASDGFCEGMDQSRLTRLQSAVRELSENQRVKAVVFVGVAGANRLRLRGQFETIGERLRFVGAGRLDESLLAVVRNGGAKP